jgi:eukaryotic-like serine/threonine-protein kinase
MTLPIGTRLGSYEVLAPLGAGGMGEVYRARDSRLHRDVAVKILPESFALDPDRLARFQREAQVLASLNHTNIAHVYGLEPTPTGSGQPGAHAIVMEFVEGPTLAELPAAMPLADAIPVAIQITAALEAAHEHGIVHRDLKPANIKLMGDGTVKVLDFGLAKAIAPEASSDGGGMHSPTITSPALTRMGLILGTAAYMAPEQAKGRTVDRRADIWAFGCVLFELLTGRRAFGGDDITDTLAFVITKEPPWDALPPDTPATIRRLLRRCLEKDPKRRLRDIADARLDLEDAVNTPVPDAAPATVGPAASGTRWIWPAALVGATCLAALVTWVATRPGVAPPPPVQRLTIAVPSTAPFAGNELAVSPDGRRIVYPATAGTQTLLYLREMDRLDAQPIKGTEGASFPFFSPDGEWVGFSAGGKLKKVSIRGGQPVTLCDAPAPGVAASWGSDDTIVFSSVWLLGQGLGQGLLRVSAAGGTPTPLTTPTEGHHRLPVFVPGRNAILFTVLGPGVVTFDSASIAVLSLDTGTYRTVIERGYHARVVSSGHVVYAAGNTLMAVAFDLDRLEARGPAVPVVEGVGPVGSAAILRGNSAFDVSRDGALVFAPSGNLSSQHTLVWVDRQGHEQPTNVPTHSYRYPRLSPDGTRIAVDVTDQGSDIWIWDIARKTLSKLTLTGSNALPAWTPDGRRVIFASTRDGGTYNLFWQAADGSGNAERLTKSALGQFPYRTTPDGKQLVIQEADRASVNINLLSLDGQNRTTPLLATAANEQTAAVSSDSRWIAYGSDESGRSEVYVRPFPKTGDGRRQVSTGGGGGPIWMSSGRELSYVRQNGSMLEVWVVPMKDGAADGAPQMVFRGAYVAFLNLNHDVTPDGRRFLMVKSVGEQSESPSTDFVAVLNWAEELKRLAPAR